MSQVEYPLGLSAKKNWAVDILERFQKAKAVLTENGWDCKENLDLSNLGLVVLPTILKVGGSFWCNGNQLTTLEGAPKEVGGHFYCDPPNKTVEQLLKEAREPKR